MFYTFSFLCTFWFLAVTQLPIWLIISMWSSFQTCLLFSLPLPAESQHPFPAPARRATCCQRVGLPQPEGLLLLVCRWSSSGICKDRLNIKAQVLTILFSTSGTFIWVNFKRELLRLKLTVMNKWQIWLCQM